MSADPIAALVHDLRTPLAVVAGFAELLEQRDERLTREQRAEYLARIRAGCEEMTRRLDAARERGAG